MVTGALEALLGADPSDEVVAAALSTIPAAELSAALSGFAREQGAAAVPLLRRCLEGSPVWAAAAASALGRVPVPASREALEAAEARTQDKSVRTAIRRARYRLRQAGVSISPPPTAPRPASPLVDQAFCSPVDGTGTSALWLVVVAPLGERTLLSAVINDQAGILEFAAGPIAKKRLDLELARLRTESTLPWVELPPTVGRARLAAAHETGETRRADVDRWLARLPEQPGPLSSRAALTASGLEPGDPLLIDRGLELLALPECQSWFLDPSLVQAASLERLAAQQSRLVVSDQIRAERQAALVDRVADDHLEGEARACWSRRLEDVAWVLVETARPDAATLALATATALADTGRPARHLAFVRGLVERSLDVAGEVALGRVPAEAVSRRAPRPGASGPPIPAGGP